MEYFTIKDIENLSGIKAHTLRIWEQRYELFTPQRKESQHRIYDNEDLKQLLRISFLYHNEWFEIASSYLLAMTTPLQNLQEALLSTHLHHHKNLH